MASTMTFDEDNTSKLHRAKRAEDRVEELESMLANWRWDSEGDHEPEKILWREALKIAERRLQKQKLG